MPNKYFIKNTGVINASGKDLIDFINRMSTNDFKKFPENEFRKTVLTTDKGRIIDLINVVNIPAAKLILTSNNFQDKVISHLDKYIIMDDVSLEQNTQKYSHIFITGDDVKNTGENLFNTQIKKHQVHKLNDDDFIFYDDFKIESLNIICKQENLDKYKNLFGEFEEINCEEYEYQRIEAGIPEGIYEFNDQINPVECGLEKYISFTKGCYIGQEVIARLDSQGKKPKQMVKINSDKIFETEDKIYLDDNKEAGFISSSIGHNEKYYGLGFIRSINLDFEKNYFAENNGMKNEMNIQSIV